MNTTINISLPKKMYEDAKSVLVAQRYASISELIRDALRKQLYPNLTVNGFTEEFEDEVLRISKTSNNNDKIWKTEEDIDEYFSKLEEEIKNSSDKD